VDETQRRKRLWNQGADSGRKVVFLVQRDCDEGLVRLRRIMQAWTKMLRYRQDTKMLWLMVS